MSVHATATFTITGWDETAYDEPAEGPKLSRATVKKAFAGDLAGESTAALLMCQAADGSAGYIASEYITGSIAGRTGSFVVQHGATITADGDAETFGHVVPGSGTGDLRGLRGTFTFGHEVLTFDYDFA